MTQANGVLNVYLCDTSDAEDKYVQDVLAAEGYGIQSSGDDSPPELHAEQTTDVTTDNRYVQDLHAD